MSKIDEKIGSAAYGFFKDFLEDTKEQAKNFFVKNKVGFLPKGMDYSDYNRIKNDKAFKQLEWMVGSHHPTLKVIMVGMHLSNQDKETREKIGNSIKDDVYEKYNKRGVSIMNMGVTGFIRPYIKMLSNYNLENNPSREELIDFYESILDDWEERSIFVKNYMKTSILDGKIRSRMRNDKKVFFVFASKTAIEVAKNTIKDMENNEIIEGNGYEYRKEILNNNEEEKVWIFGKKDIINSL